MTPCRTFLLILWLCLGPASVHAADLLILGHNSPAGGPHSIGAHFFAEELQRRLPGRFQINEKGGVSMGAEPDLWDAVRLGAIDIALVTNISLGPSIPEFDILSIPLLFRDSDHASHVLNGPFGRMLAERLEQAGVEALAWGELGFRQMTNSQHPIRVPDDVAGLRMRIVPNPIYLRTVVALGGHPIEIYLSELYNALKMNIADGEDNPLLVFEANHLYEVQKYVSLTNIFYNPLIFMMNKERFDHLSAEEKVAVRAAAIVGAQATRRAVVQREAAVLRMLESQGIAVETADRAAFERKLVPLLRELDEQFGAARLRQIRETP